MIGASFEKENNLYRALLQKRPDNVCGLLIEKVPRIRTVQCIRKRALYLCKRAMYPHKNPVLHKTGLFLHKTGLFYIKQGSSADT